MTPQRFAELRKCGLPKNCDAYRKHMELVAEVERLQAINVEVTADFHRVQSELDAVEQERAVLTPARKVKA